MDDSLPTAAWALLFVVLLALLLDDLLLWVEEGVVPGVEFLAVGLAAVAAVFLALRWSTSIRPPKGR